MKSERLEESLNLAIVSFKVQSEASELLSETQEEEEEEEGHRWRDLSGVYFINFAWEEK